MKALGLRARVINWCGFAICSPGFLAPTEVAHTAAGPVAPRILIAEDNLVNQKVLLKVLQRVLPDARPKVVGNGCEALQACSARFTQHCSVCASMREDHAIG